MTSSESDSQPPPRKRSRTESNGDDGAGKKARGRPRVDTQDATAADRRRTQIRLAQRAYRQRKETTISSLKNQNTRLQSIIEQMNKSFLQFNDAALKLGILQLNPTIAQELKRATESFVALAKSAGEGDEDGDEEAANGDFAFDHAEVFQKATAAARSAADRHAADATRPPVAQHAEVDWGFSSKLDNDSSKTSSILPHRRDIPTHSQYFKELPASAPEGSSLVSTRPRMTAGQVFDQSLSYGYQPSEQLPFGLIDLMPPDPGLYNPQPQIYNLRIPSPRINTPQSRLSTPPSLLSLSTKSITPDWTYSHDEVTFARRLSRAAIEAGFHMLSSAKERPVAANYIFRLTLPYVGLEALRDRFKSILARGTNEDLDCWETPFIHLGGAGTHYPKKDHLGNIVPIPNAWKIRSIGPIPKGWVRAENAADPSLSHDISIDLTGFEGEWFDPHDVEGYLEESKGCRITPQNSFAEVLVDVDVDDATSTETATSLIYPEDTSISYKMGLQSGSPGLSHGTGSSPGSISSTATPKHTNLDILGQETFGLDMGMGMDMGMGTEMGLGLGTDMNNSNDSSKIDQIDISAIFDQPLGLDLAPVFDTAIRGFDTGSLGNTPNGALSTASSSFEQVPIVKQKQKRAALVDVDKLVNELIKRAVCLGRAPGFRRKDVDVAFRASLIDAF